MCRALRVLCAAADAERLADLKRSSVATHWELVGGAASVLDLERQVVEFEPDVVVVDAALGGQALECLRVARRTPRLVAVGPLAGADAQISADSEIRAAILGLPHPGGPVRK